MSVAFVLVASVLAAEATPVDGKPFAAKLVRIAAGGAVFQTADGERNSAREELVQWGAAPDAERGAQVFLADGSILVGDVLSVDDKELRLGDATGLGRGWWQDLKLPLTLVRGVVLQPSADPDTRERQRRQAALATRSQDELALVDDKTLSGLLLPAAVNDAGLTAIRWQVRGLTKPAEIPLARVAAINLANLSGKDPPPKPQWTFALDDGSRLNVVKIRGTTFELQSGLQLTPHLEDAADETPLWNAVCYIAGDSPRVVYLSDKPPQEYRHRPLLSGELPLGRDVNAFGGPLATANGIFPRGLGAHTTSAATFVVPKNSERFAAECFIDRSAGERGSVIFAVSVERDGEWKEVFASDIVRGGDAPIAVVVELPGVTRIRLETRAADRGDEGDRANWGSARWILKRDL